MVKKQVILVSTGVFQTYIKENINQLLKFDFDIHVIIDSPFLNKFNEYGSSIKIIDSSSIYTNFDEISKLNRNFRNGFWHHASKRLFLMYEYIKCNNIRNVIHLENDVLLYSSMNYNFDEKIYITMDSKNRCIPGIIYIPKYDLFTNLIENYNCTQDDMNNLAIFYNNNKDIVKTFPIIDNSIKNCIYNENFLEFNSIFDGAAIGQYLGGTNPINVLGDTTGFVNERCAIKYDKYKFRWIKKGEYSFPYIEINNKLIPINNLHIHSKNLEQFRMEDPVENKYIIKQHNKMNFITGEKIQFICNHFIGADKDFKYNPNVAQYTNRFIHIGSNVNIDNEPLIFCYTHLLKNINNLIKTLKSLQNPFKLVFHNSDGSLDNHHLILFNKIPLLQCIYTQNMNVNHEKVFPLPIGLANSQWKHGNSKTHQQIYDMSIKKTEEIYFNFNKNTSKAKRNKCYNDIRQKGISWNETLPYKEYLIELKRHKYAICPEGNGIDTHRFWECLYMNTIPICLKNAVTEYYKQYFPIITLDDWNDLDIKKLNYSNNNHKFLDMQNIIDNIKHMSSKIKIKFLAIGHPRCGSGFTSYYFNLLGLKSFHEVIPKEHLNNFDCLSSWAFTIEHIDKDAISPRYGYNGWGWRKNYIFEKKIVHIRNPFDSLGAIIAENKVKWSYNIRSKYIYKKLNKVIEGNNVEKAILCYLYWYEILLNDCDFYFRIEHDLEKLNNYIKSVANIDINSINTKIDTKVNTKKDTLHMDINDYSNVNPSIMNKLNNFCIKYEYPVFNEYFK